MRAGRVATGQRLVALMVLAGWSLHVGAANVACDNMAGVAQTARAAAAPGPLATALNPAATAPNPAATAPAPAATAPAPAAIAPATSLATVRQPRPFGYV